jgi:iron uptake system component EfeO
VRPVRVLVALLALALAATACDSAEPHRSKASRVTVQVSVSQCGTGWSGGRAGTQHLLLHNTDSRPGEARVIDPGSGAVFADVEPIGHATTVPLDVTLRAGNYAIACLMEDEAPVTGREQTVRGRLAAGLVATPGVVPVTQADLIPATQDYQRFVSAQLPHLSAGVAALRVSVVRGERAAAERDWLTAHLRYERLGAAYDAFGDLDAAINGLDRGSDWSGFHRIEAGLWHGAPLSSLVAQVDTLQRTVTTLRRQFAHAQIDPLQIGFRAHEISENALEFSLTGIDDYGSHSDLATIQANQQGTTTVLGLVTSLLRSRHVDLTAIRAAIARTDDALARRPVDREQLDAALSQQCEVLAPVASVLEPRRTS